MRPTALSMTNFMPYAQPTEVDLSSIHLACLAGENGHGKSAIIDALTWCLWGKARARRDDELIHLGQEQMEVRLDFSLEDQEYRVIRQRDRAGRGSSTLEFQISGNGQWRALTGDTMRETQEVIDSTIRMDYDTFINSALLLQGRADEFTNQTPGERKRILGEILGLGLWDSLENKAKVQAREAETELTRIGARAEQMDEELSQQPDHEAALDEAARETESLAGELEEAEGALSQEKEKATELSFKRQALSDTEGEIGKRDGELQALMERIAAIDISEVERYRRSLDDVRVDLVALEDELSGDEKANHQEKLRLLSNEGAALETTNERLKADMEDLKDEMDMLADQDAECPVCGTELTLDQRTEILSDKETEGTQMAAEYRQNRARLDEIKAELSSVERGLSLIDQQTRKMAGLKEKQLQLMQEIAEMEADQNRVEEWQGQAEALEGVIGELSIKRDRLREELAGAEELAASVRKLETEVKRVDEDLSRARQRLGAAKQKLDHCEYLQAEKEKLEEQQGEAAQAKAIYDELRLAFGKRGIQAMIIETVLPEIEEQANELLARMTDGRMSVAFESQRETKKGTLSETLDIHVADELGVRSYDLFSGGEAFRINFAIRIAVSKLLARRAGAQLQTLIMDEGFGSQDSQGRDRLVEAIQSVAGDFSLILVVTHIDELKEVFPSQILIQKGPAGSLVSVN